MTFTEHVQKRMEKGRREYGDTSYQRPVTEILDEMLEEFADVAGWGSIAFSHELPGAVRCSIAEAISYAREGYKRLKVAKMLLGMQRGSACPRCEPVEPLDSALPIRDERGFVHGPECNPRPKSGLQIHVRVDGPAGGSIELGHVEGRRPSKPINPCGDSMWRYLDKHTSFFNWEAK